LNNYLDDSSIQVRDVPNEMISFRKELNICNNNRVFYLKRDDLLNFFVGQGRVYHNVIAPSFLALFLFGIHYS